MQHRFVYSAMALVVAANLALPVAFAASEASFALDPATGDFIVDETITTAVTVDTQGQETDEVDIVVQYDTTLLEVVDQDPDKAGIQVEEGELYEVTLKNEVNTGTGLITFTQTSLTPDGFYTTTAGNPPGVAMRVTFKALAAGTADVSFVTDDTTNNNISKLLSVDDNVLQNTDSAVFSIEAAQQNTTDTVNPISTLLISASTTTLPADGLSQAQITITALDSEGRNVPNSSILLALSEGTATLDVPSNTTDENGQLAVTLRASTTPGTVTINAQSSENAGVFAGLSITQEAAEPVEPPPAPLPSPSTPPVEEPVLLQEGPSRLTNSGPADWNVLIAFLGVVLLGTLSHVRKELS